MLKISIMNKNDENNNKLIKEYTKYKCRYINMKLGTKHIYIMRHGETDYNKSHIYQGQEYDVPINENGKEQAMKTGMYFKKYRLHDGQFDCILSSPLLRAKETANIIKETIGFNNEIIYMNQLVEREKGILDGKNRDHPIRKDYWELKQKYMSLDDPIERYIQEDMATIELNKKHSAGVETDNELEIRAMNVLEQIVTLKCSKILIVAHGGILMAMFRKIFNIPRIPFGDLSNGDNCWITYITYNDKYGYKMISPPNTSHLALGKIE